MAIVPPSVDSKVRRFMSVGDDITFSMIGTLLDRSGERGRKLPNRA
jgi:hypothetical protein